MMQNGIYSNSRTGNIAIINNAMRLLVAESTSDSWSERGIYAHVLVIKLVSIVNRTILTRALLHQSPLSAFRRLVNCGRPEGVTVSL